MKHLMIISILLCTMALSAQQRFPRLTVGSGDNEQNVILRDIEISVVVLGGIARTTYDMTFYNAENRVLEGRFQLPLDRQ